MPDAGPAPSNRRMQVHVRSETVIARPRAEVTAFATDFERMPLWFRKIRWVEWESEARVQAGARLAFITDMLGKRRQACSIEEHVPGERLRLQIDGPYALDATFAWRDAAGSQTHMTLDCRARPKGLWLLALPVLPLLVSRANAHDLALLKAILERRAGRPRVA